MGKAAVKREVALHAEAIRAVFLEELKECGDVVLAAKKADVSVSRVYGWTAVHEEFAEAVRAARDHGDKVKLSTLEREAYRRAVEGWDEPVFQKGGVVGYVRRYDSNLVMFLIKKLDPSYRERPPDNVITTGSVVVQVASFSGPPPALPEAPR